MGEGWSRKGEVQVYMLYFLKFKRVYEVSSLTKSEVIYSLSCFQIIFYMFCLLFVFTLSRSHIIFRLLEYFSGCSFGMLTS